MDDADREWLASYCNRLPFVAWDRVVVWPDGSYAEVYGWIARDDGRSDFVVLSAWPETRLLHCLSSSAERSHEIGNLIAGRPADAEPEGHVDCQRVEDVLGELVPGAIRL
jgi:hypothetical protein